MEPSERAGLASRGPAWRSLSQGSALVKFTLAEHFLLLCGRAGIRNTLVFSSYISSPFFIPQKVRGVRGRVGCAQGQLVGQGADEGGEGTLQLMIMFTLPFLLVRMGLGLWRLMAPISLATAVWDLGVWFCLSQSHNLTIHRSAVLALTSPSSLRPNKIAHQTPGQPLKGAILNLPALGAQQPGAGVEVVLWELGLSIQHGLSLVSA